MSVTEARPSRLLYSERKLWDERPEARNVLARLSRQRFRLDTYARALEEIATETGTPYARTAQAALDVRQVDGT